MGTGKPLVNGVTPAAPSHSGGSPLKDTVPMRVIGESHVPVSGWSLLMGGRLAPVSNVGF